MQELWSNPWDSTLMEIVTLETSWKTFLTRFLESKYQFVITLILGVESFKINTDPTISL